MRNTKAPVELEGPSGSFMSVTDATADEVRSRKRIVGQEVEWVERTKLESTLCSFDRGLCFRPESESVCAEPKRENVVATQVQCAIEQPVSSGMILLIERDHKA